MGLADGSLRGIGDPLEVYVALSTLLERPAWQSDALCREYLAVNFFPGQGEATEPAKSICAMCIVRAECLAYALERGEEGVWGGTAKAERTRMRKVVSTSGRQPWVAAKDRMHCVNGHPFDEANTRIYVSRGRPYRYCKACAVNRRQKDEAA